MESENMQSKVEIKLTTDEILEAVRFYVRSKKLDYVTDKDALAVTIYSNRYDGVTGATVVIKK